MSVLRTSMKPKVAIIDNSIYPELYKPVEHWKSYLNGVEWRSFYAPHGELPRLKDFTHILLTGSEASILERERWVEREVEFVQDAAAAGRVLLGSCYGHQLLALALAGPAHVGRCREPEIGWITIDLVAPSPLLGDPGQADTFSVHFDEVRNLPEPFVVLASTDICAVQAFGTRSGRVWGLQIHPEIDEPSARNLLSAFRAVFPAFRPLYEKALASPSRDSNLIYKIVNNFLLSCLDN